MKAAKSILDAEKGNPFFGTAVANWTQNPFFGKDVAKQYSKYFLEGVSVKSESRHLGSPQERLETKFW